MTDSGRYIPSATHISESSYERPTEYRAEGPFEPTPAPYSFVVAPEVTHAINIGRSVRNRLKAKSPPPVRSPPKIASPRTQGTSGQKPSKSVREHKRGRRRRSHKPLLTERLDHMSKPSKRSVLGIWRDKAEVLPGDTIDRLRRLLNAKDALSPTQAYDYFRAVKNGKKKIVKKGAQKSGNESKRLNKRLRAARNASVAFARGLRQRLSRPGNFTLRDEMLRLSNIILSDMCRYMKTKTPTRRCKHPKAKFMMEMADKIAIWIDDILQNSDDRMMMMDLDLDEDVINADRNGGAGDGGAGFTDDFLNMMSGGGLFKGPKPAYLRFSGAMSEAFDTITSAMKSKGNQPLLTHGHFKQSYSEAADELKAAKNFDATAFDTKIAGKLNNDLMTTVSPNTPKYLSESMKHMVDICSNYLAQHAESNKHKGTSFNLLTNAMKSNAGDDLYQLGKAKRNMGQAARELEKSHSLETNHDNPIISQEIHEKLSQLASPVTPRDLAQDMSDTLANSSKYLSQIAVDENDRGPAFEQLVKTLEREGSKSFTPEHPSISSDYSAAHVLKSAPGLSGVVPDPATTSKLSMALHRAVDNSTPRSSAGEMNEAIKKSASYLSAFVRDRDKTLIAIIKMMKKNPNKMVATRNNYSMNYETAANELETAPALIPYLPVKDIADEAKAKLNEDMQAVTPPELLLATKNAIADAANYLAQLVAIRSGASGGRYPLYFLVAIMNSMGDRPLFKFKGFGMTYADAAETLKYSGQLQSDARADQLAYQICAELIRGVGSRLSPNVTRSLGGTMTNASKHLAKLGMENADALEYLTNQMVNKGDDTLAVLQGHPQSYSDVATRLKGAKTLSTDKVDKGAYATVGAKLLALYQEKPSTSHSDVMPGIIDDTAKFLATPMPVNSVEKRQLLSDLMARKGDDIFDAENYYKMTYAEAGEEIMNVPEVVDKPRNPEKCRRNIEKIRAVIPDQRLKDMLKKTTEDAGVHLTNTVKGRAAATDALHEALKQEGDADFFTIGIFCKNYDEAADMISEAPNFGGQEPHPFVKQEVAARIRALNTQNTSGLAQQYLPETSDLASNYIAGVATKESGLNMKELDALDPVIIKHEALMAEPEVDHSKAIEDRKARAQTGGITGGAFGAVLSDIFGEEKAGVVGSSVARLSNTFGPGGVKAEGSGASATNNADSGFAGSRISSAAGFGTGVGAGGAPARSAGGVSGEAYRNGGEATLPGVTTEGVKGPERPSALGSDTRGADYISKGVSSTEAGGISPRGFSVAGGVGSSATRAAKDVSDTAAKLGTEVTFLGDTSVAGGTMEHGRLDASGSGGGLGSNVRGGKGLHKHGLRSKKHTGNGRLGAAGESEGRRQRGSIQTASAGPRGEFDPEYEAALDVLHRQLRSKGDEIFYSQPQTELTYSGASDWLKMKPSMNVDNSAKYSGDTDRLSSKFERKLNSLVSDSTPAGMESTMQDVVIESARSLAEIFISSNYKALVKDGLIAEMQKKGNEILIKVDDEAETFFYAAQRLKKATTYDVDDYYDDVSDAITKKLDDMIRYRSMARKLTGTMKENIREAADYLSIIVTEPDSVINAYVALLEQMEATEDAILIKEKITKSFKESAAYLRGLTTNEDLIKRPDGILKSSIVSKLRKIMKDVPKRGYQSNHLREVINKAAGLLVSYVKLHDEKTRVLKILVDTMKTEGSNVLLRHGVIRKSFTDGAGLLEGKHAEELEVINADPVVARKIQIKLIHLIKHTNNIPLNCQGIIDDVIEEATLYLAVSLLHPKPIKICTCTKNVREEFVQCELWCEEILRRVIPRCPCSHNTAPNNFKDIFLGKRVRNPDTNHILTSNLDISVTKCSHISRSANRRCLAPYRKPERLSNDTEQCCLYSTASPRYHSPPRRDEPDMSLCDTLSSDTSAMITPRSQFDIETRFHRNVISRLGSPKTSSLSSYQTLVSHSVTNAPQSEKPPYWQEPTTMFANCETSRGGYNTRTPIVSTDQMSDWHAMMVSLMWNVQAWRDWIQNNIDRALAQQDSEISAAEAEEKWIVYQRKVSREALQWRQYNIFSQQLTLRLSLRYKDKQIVSPTRATNKTRNYVECQEEIMQIIIMFNKWTKWLTAVVNETDLIYQNSGTPGCSNQMQVQMRWSYFRQKILEHSEDWSAYNSHLKLYWEHKYKTLISEWLPEWKQPGPVWVVSACGAVPSGAVSAGIYDNELIWVARTTHKCTVLPASLHPTRHCCVVYADGGVHHYTKYQVMCNAKVEWKAWRAGAVGARAVRVAQGTYIGRVHYRGSHLIGPVHAPHFRCHVIIFGRPFAFNCYEILVLNREDTTK